MEPIKVLRKVDLTIDYFTSGEVLRWNQSNESSGVTKWEMCYMHFLLEPEARHESA